LGVIRGIAPVLDAGDAASISSSGDECRGGFGEARQPAHTPVTQRAVSLLIVERHVDTAESMQLLLEALGYRVLLAADATSALAIVETTELDAAFLAINLPDLDGYALARRLRELGRPRVLIALTGYGLDEDRRRATEAGFDDHVLKPASVEQLENVLARFLATDVR
jgi:CheY-like chemotaxis protein